MAEWRRLKACVRAWPDCIEGAYNPACCRFPKSCSCLANVETTPEHWLEPEYLNLTEDDNDHAP